MQSGNKITAAIVFAFLSVLMVPAAFAQESVEGGTGLIFIDKAATPPSGGISVGGYYFTQDIADLKPETTFTSYGLTLSAGLTDKVELSVLLPFVNLGPRHISGDGWIETLHESESGVFDGLLKAKYNFVTTGGGFRYSVLGALTLPLGDDKKHLGTGKTDPGIGLVVDKEYENITWHFMGVYMNYTGKEQDPAVNYGAGFEWRILDPVSVVGEISGRVWSKQELHRTDNTKQSFAARYHFGHPGESSVVGSAFLGYSSWGAGSGEGSPNHLTAVGITLEFGHGHAKHEAAERVHGAGAAGEGGKAPGEAGQAGAGAAGEGGKAPGEGGQAGAAAGEGGKGPGEAGQAGAGAGAGAAERIIVDLKPIHFEFDSAELTNDAVASLKENARIFRDNPMAKVVVEGHACSIGPSGYNHNLGLKRAKSVKKFLVKELGVDTDKIFVVLSQGEGKPAQDNSTSAGRAANRRVEFLKN